MIPAEAVEVAAKASYEHDYKFCGASWAEASGAMRSEYSRGQAVALEAALPFFRQSEVTHNHLTRDLRQEGQCPACDNYWNQQKETS